MLCLDHIGVSFHTYSIKFIILRSSMHCAVWIKVFSNTENIIENKEIKKNVYIYTYTYLSQPLEMSPHSCTCIPCSPGVKPSTVPSIMHPSGV